MTQNSVVCFLFLLCCLHFYSDVSCENQNKGRGLLDLFLSPCKCRCGIPNREGRVIGGEFLKTYEFPWLALVQIKGVVSVPATLINDRYVLTAATAVLGLTPYDVKVSLGVFDRCAPDVSSTNVSVEKITLHPDFSPGNRAHDLALIKLSTPVTIERRISPVCLSTPGTQYLGQVSTLVGWSQAVIPDGSLVSSCVPRKLGLPILDYKDCVASAFNPAAVSQDKHCAGILGVPSVVCKSDTGGPVMYRTKNGVYELIGVLTDNNDCGPKPSTALFTAINPHLSWISHNTRDACFCFKT